MAQESVVLQSFTAGNIVVGVLAYVLLSFAVSIISAPRFPTSIPWVGHGKGWLAGMRNMVDAFTKHNQWLHEGYTKYNKNDKTYVLPGTFASSKEIVIPRSQIQWMLEQPDSVLSTSEAHYDSLHGDYSFIDKNVLKDPYHERVIHKNMTRHLNTLLPDLSDEVLFNVDRVYGTDAAQWKKVNIMNAFFEMVPKITNRMLVGETLCRDQGYIDACVAFTTDIIRNMLLFALTPKALKAIVGPLAGLPSKYHFKQTTKFTYPIIKQRLEDIRRKDAGENKEWKEPEDYFTWHIRTAQADGRSDMLAPNRIAQCLLPLNFAAIHTTSLTGHSTLLDIFSTDPKLGVAEALREEAERIYREENGQWTKEGLARMYKMDSAIRESMRYSSFATTQSARKVIAPEGITNPQEGWHAPYGTMITCPLYSIAMDGDYYNGADVYDPFRFSREREAYEAKPAEEKNPKEGLKLRATGLVTTSDKHFPFGHGRHACPGRFLVAHELKILLAHLLMNYDIKYFDQRPQPKWIGRNQVPPADACLEVKRRQ